MADATISKTQPNSNFGASTTCAIEGGTNERSCLVRWDLTYIPTTATVSSAAITLNVVDGSAATFFPVYYLKRSWNESTVTWNNAMTGTLWGSPGAKATTDRGGPFTGIPGNSGLITYTLSQPALAVIQSWVTTPASNRGIALANETTTDPLLISARETAGVASDPVLTVWYQ